MKTLKKLTLDNLSFSPLTFVYITQLSDLSLLELHRSRYLDIALLCKNVTKLKNLKQLLVDERTNTAIRMMEEMVTNYVQL